MKGSGLRTQIGWRQTWSTPVVFCCSNLFALNQGYERANLLTRHIQNAIAVCCYQVGVSNLHDLATLVKALYAVTRVGVSSSGDAKKTGTQLYCLVAIHA